MGIKAWFKEHKKLVTRVGVGVLIGGAFGVACRLIFKEDVNVDQVIPDSIIPDSVTPDSIVLDKPEFERIMTVSKFAGMDALYDILKHIVPDLGSYAGLDEYLADHPDIAIEIPSCYVEKPVGSIAIEASNYGRYFEF